MKYLLIFFISLSFIGCTIQPATPNQTSQIANGIQEASKFLSTGLLDIDPKIKSKYITITTFVNLNNFNNTSSFGRVLPEMMLTNLYKQGYNISDYRTAKGLKIKQMNGEFILTRNSTNMNKLVINDYLLIGTYTIDKDIVILNARLIDTTEGKIISSTHVFINKYSIQYLLNKKEPLIAKGL
jgi:TolB-like protein